jgi:CheY-like chemotaxis protein
VPPHVKLPVTAPLVALDDSEEDIFIFRRLLAKAKVTRPFCPLLSADAFMTWLPTIFAAKRINDRPLVCFLDIKMPGTTGLEVLRWIRRQEVFDPLPIVMLSSSDDPRDLTDAAKQGAQCYVTKYPSTTVLGEIVRDAEAYANDADNSGFMKPYNLLASLPKLRPNGR